MQDLRRLPKLRDSLSYIYAEKSVIQRYRHAVEIVDERGKTAIPIASLSVLLLGPGTRITHEAVKLLARNGCSIVWVGEDTTRFYAQGTGETRKGHRLLHQARLVSDPRWHREIAMRMYAYRFDDPLPDDLTIQQLRGHEGARVRNTYQFMSRRYGVKWNGRRYDRGTWEKSDPINRALSAANALLNGICHAAIVSGGFSPGLGFIHTGKQLSFVYDVADLYKTEITIPVAFETRALGSENIESRVRQRMREKLRETKLLKRILPDLDELLSVGDDLDEWDILDEDGALPTPLWDDEENTFSNDFEEGEE
jgi:CRISPR-associated protein Cas1